MTDRIEPALSPAEWRRELRPTLAMALDACTEEIASRTLK
jgi:hypothetical protein